MRILLLISILLAPFKAGAADTVITFNKTFGGKSDDYGYSLEETSDKGYIILGSTTSFGAGGKDMYLIKINKYGKKVWERTYGGKLDDVGKSVLQTPDGGYILFGYTFSSGKGKASFYLIKTDSDGRTLWEKTYGGLGSDYGYSVKHTDDGGYMLYGYSVKQFNEGSDLLLIKTDSSGKELWEKTFDGGTNDFGYSADHTSDGGFILLGRTEDNAKKTSHLYLVKTNEKGRKRWGMAIGTNSANSYYPYYIKQVSDGDFIITGTTIIQSRKLVYLLRMNEDGVKLWSTIFDIRHESYGRSVQETKDGGFIILGYTKRRTRGKHDMYILRTDSKGKVLWEKSFGKSADDFGHAVKVTSDGGYALLGYTEPKDDDVDVYLLKLDSNGNLNE
jgi:hypothetical protein